MRIFVFISLILNFIGKTLWPAQLGQTELLLSFIVFIVNLIVLTIVFYVVGIVVVGKKRTKFGDAFVISLFGTLTGTILNLFISQYWVGAILSLIVWLLLIRRYYETGWLRALAVGILAVVVMVVLVFVLELLVAIGLILSD